MTSSPPLGSRGVKESVRPPDAIRARRRPGTIVAVYLARAALSIAIAWPVAAILGGYAGGFATGDSVLFEPGGLFLVEAVRLGARAATSAAMGSAWLALWALYLDLLPLGALLGALNRPGKLTAAELAADAARPFGTFSVLLGLTLLAGAFSCSFFWLAGSLFSPERRSGLVGIALVGSGATFVLALLATLHDLARAAAVRHGLGARRALLCGALAFVRAPWAALLGSASRVLAGTALVASVSFVVDRLPLASARGFSAIAALHQLVALGLVALRASWLAHALRLVARQTPDID